MKCQEHLVEANTVYTLRIRRRYTKDKVALGSKIDLVWVPIALRTQWKGISEPNPNLCCVHRLPIGW